MSLFVMPSQKILSGDTLQTKCVCNFLMLFSLKSHSSVRMNCAVTNSVITLFI